MTGGNGAQGNTAEDNMDRGFEPGPECAARLDAEDTLASYRDEFLFPPGADGKPMAYFAGNSLGLQPRGVRARLEQELEDWERLAVHAHLEGVHPWYTYHEPFRGPLSRLVGARESEVVLMNSLTLNLHLLMVSLYRPTAERFRILIESPVFPSDLYAMQSHLRHRGLDPAKALIQVGPREGEDVLHHEDVETVLAEKGDGIALLLMGGMNFLTGQFLDIERLTRAAHDAGAMAAFDLAHAAGNVPLRLHDWGVDFAAWCSYKYLNGGPGAMSGAYIHEHQAANVELPRFGGWWANDPTTRFRMQLEPEFHPRANADGWQISNPSVFSAAPLAVAMDLHDRAGMEALRAKSVRLTGYFEYLVRTRAGDRARVVTPSDPDRRGCQLSLRLTAGARNVEERLRDVGVICDFREPDILRAAPASIYNSFQDVWRLVDALRGIDS